MAPLRVAAVKWSTSLPLPAGPTTSVPLAAGRLRGFVGLVCIADRSANEFAVERKRLQHDVEAVAVIFASIRDQPLADKSIGALNRVMVS